MSDAAPRPASGPEEAVRRVIALSAQLVDAGDFDAWSALYAVDGRHVRNGVSYEGRPAILEFMRVSYGSRGLHLCGPSVIEVDAAGGRAWATTDYAFIRSDGGVFQVAGTGRYEDRFVRHDGGWYIAERAVTSTFPL